MILEVIAKNFSVCKLARDSQIDIFGNYCFVSKTDNELSLVCGSESVPENAVSCSSGWRAFRIQGVLDFSLTGILSRILGILAAESIGIFAVSTYDTDYVFVKQEYFTDALSALAGAGYEIKR